MRQSILIPNLIQVHLFDQRYSAGGQPPERAHRFVNSLCRQGKAVNGQTRGSSKNLFSFFTKSFIEKLLLIFTEELKPFEGIFFAFGYLVCKNIPEPKNCFG